ncbi:major facilitator superfamily domain-containing protein [Emericellopsis atlantica]|uniref:Major facilitator superfamily domain-containing protein n=1 Tax=Emericellopsis atlantica TaxID=2614577 RepID=A0A9P8CNJ0_9HYPO|nr:major facilitator superfamily domain-containing protein [Emericellopsis atlantica]KAG9253182.1 major facilitator superfamily domain-containing protein [Emericellopsis atlantica]
MDSQELGIGATQHDGPQHEGQQQLQNDEDAWTMNPANPWNWSTGKKAVHMVMLSCSALLASIGTSVMSPARSQIMEEFHVSSPVALLPLSLYVLALGLGSIVGSPLSETVGRHPVYLGTVPLGAVFTLGAGFTHNFGALCFLRFMAGFCWAPVLATAAGSLSDLFAPRARGPPSAIFILMPFLGPGLGPVIGSFLVVEKSWRWTQWTLLFLAAACIIVTAFTKETMHHLIQERAAGKANKHEGAATTSVSRPKLSEFVTIALVRPVHMLVSEPIVAMIALYVSAEFGTLFSFFAGVPYTFARVYGFPLHHSGLVFLSIVIGCLLGLVTIILCDTLLYRKKAQTYASHEVPPELRLFPAMLGSVGLPVGLFWFAWTAKADVSWASPAAAMIPFAWGNLCVFVATIQYMSDTYPGRIVASAASANTLARYGFAAVFPLFTIQMYETLGIAWATSLLGFVALALMPIPWCFYRFGPTIRARSRYT